MKYLTTYLAKHEDGCLLFEDPQTQRVFYGYDNDSQDPVLKGHPSFVAAGAGEQAPYHFEVSAYAHVPVKDVVRSPNCLPNCLRDAVLEMRDTLKEGFDAHLNNLCESYRAAYGTDPKYLITQVRTNPTVLPADNFHQDTPSLGYVAYCIISTTATNCLPTGYSEAHTAETPSLRLRPLTLDHPDEKTFASGEGRVAFGNAIASTILI